MRVRRIMLVEDDQDHAELITHALKENITEKEIILIKDGEEAIDYFNKMDLYEEEEEIQAKVNLVILDLKLPKVDGMDVLKFLKNSPKYCSIPVIIMSTTSEINTVLEGYKRGVNSFITKPISYDDFVEKVRSLNKYWMQTCILPIPT